MKKMLPVLMTMILALTLCLGGAAATEPSGFLGNPFPDFTATDTEGNPFTLSEALKDHEAVLINFWASWCPPCRGEFPYLEQVRAEEVEVLVDEEVFLLGAHGD